MTKELGAIGPSSLSNLKYWTHWQLTHPVRAVWSIRWFCFCYCNNQNSTIDQVKWISQRDAQFILWCQVSLCKGNKNLEYLVKQENLDNIDRIDVLEGYGVDTSILICNSPRSKIIMLALHWNKPCVTHHAGDCSSGYFTHNKFMSIRSSTELEVICLSAPAQVAKSRKIFFVQTQYCRNVSGPHLFLKTAYMPLHLS